MSEDSNTIDIRDALIGKAVIELVRESGRLHKKRGRKASTGGKKRGRKTNAERERLAAEETAKAPRKPRPSELAKKKKKKPAAPPPDEQVDEREDEEEEEEEE